MPRSRYRPTMTLAWHGRVLRALALPIVLFAALFSFAHSALAAPNHIAAELVSEAPAAPGSTVMLAVHMTPEAGWHGYWENPGDAGLGMQLDWRLPHGAKAGTARYPVPQTLLIAGLMNHVYEHEFAVLVPLTIPDDAREGSRVPVLLDAQWLACTDKICVPERATLATEVPVTAVVGQTRDTRFDRWMSQLPAPLGSPAHFSVDSRTVRIGIPLPKGIALEDPHFFMRDDKVVDYAAPQMFARSGDLLIVTLPRATFDPRDPETLSGVLRLDGRGTGLTVSASPGIVPTGGTPVNDGSAPQLPTLPWLLLAAVAGGLILNVMPCVFPILSLKALGLARAGESEAQARAEGAAYAAGIIVACLALGGLLLALRAAGEQVGWAFQLQQPGVVAALLMLAVALTANFFGAFEISLPGLSTAGSPKGAFATGLLAAFVATPCTGPFMASAMGAALLLPVAPAMALFAALGLGIALPFLAIAFIPGLRQRLPRPGPWMTRFRHWMALPMGLTAAALVWLCWKVGGVTFVASAIALSAALIVLLVLAGKRQRKGRSALAMGSLGLLAVATGTALIPMTVREPVSGTASILDAQPFSETALAKARAEGKPVFAWFTADWCLTCKVNEEVAIEREETRRAFEKAGVIVLLGDWTRSDPEITRYLTSQGAAGVPLYVWYPAGGSGEKLPQVLTPGLLVQKAQEKQ